MATPKVDPGIVGARFDPYEFEWDWTTSQLIARAVGCSIDDEIDRPLMLRDSQRSAHPMIAFNGALLARNRAVVMDRLIGGYDTWQDVGRWGSGGAKLLCPLPRQGRGRVGCGFTEVGGTSKGHALVRFTFEVEDASSGRRLMEGWMLLFLLGCGSEEAGKITAPRIAMPDREPDQVVRHETPVNVTFDWAVPSRDWNTTHFETKGENPAPLVHGPRNMALVLQDGARAFAGNDLDRVKEITLGSLPAPHYPPEPTETRCWREGEGRVLARLVVPGASRIDGGSDDKIVIDQVEIRLG